MFPRTTLDELLHSTFANAVSLGEPSDTATINTTAIGTTDFQNLFFSELSFSMILSFALSVLSLSVGYIIQRGPDEEMVRVHARWVITMMAHMHTIANLAEVDTPRQTMGVDVLFSENSVPFFSPSCPNPALTTDRMYRTFFVHFCPERLSQVSKSSLDIRIAMSLPKCVMALTQLMVGLSSSQTPFNTTWEYLFDRNKSGISVLTPSHIVLETPFSSYCWRCAIGDGTEWHDATPLVALKDKCGRSVRFRPFGCTALAA